MGAADSMRPFRGPRKSRDRFMIRMKARIRFVATAAVELRRHDREQRTTGRSTLTATAPRGRRRPKPR